MEETVLEQIALHDDADKPLLHLVSPVSSPKSGATLEEMPADRIQRARSDPSLSRSAAENSSKALISRV
jgi:hypothetical protein